MPAFLKTYFEFFFGDFYIHTSGIVRQSTLGKKTSVPPSSPLFLPRLLLPVSQLSVPIPRGKVGLNKEIDSAVSIFEGENRVVF